ncbi:hypothetical protein OG21DRAFT_1380350, partial [Imleria badia]
FFHPRPAIIDVDRRCAYNFKYAARGCKVKVRRYNDTKDARSTSNLRKHVKVCKGWGKEILETADQAKNANEVKSKLIGRLQDGIIMAMFERKGKGQVTYMHWQHTRDETCAEIVCWVNENLCPFDIVSDQSFRTLMKTGQPEYYLP